MEVYKQSKLMFINNLDAILIVFFILLFRLCDFKIYSSWNEFPIDFYSLANFCLPFYYQRKILPINSTVFSVILFLFIVLFSGALNFGNQYSNGDTVSVFGSIALYFILISLLDSYDLIKKSFIS